MGPLISILPDLMRVALSLKERAVRSRELTIKRRNIGAVAHVT